ncbi:MAG: glycosyltransferase family 4 protein [Alphaproteobacteria bacterium]|nr:glycosyltransferase family 4 protein [Alphaproteobacteria bacterium]
MKEDILIGFAWPELPEYAAHCIRAVGIGRSIPPTVIATRPKVPLKHVEDVLGASAYWIEQNTTGKVTWASLGLKIPDIFFIGGYATPSFNRLADEARAAGSAVIVMVDNNLPPPSLSRLARSLYHRIFRRRHYDGIFVPGKSGRKLARSWGYSDNHITEGLYGANPVQFNGGDPLADRPKDIIFVGQFIERKHVLGLVKAFMRFAERHPEWTLTLCGNGPLQSCIPAHRQIKTLGFVQPAELADLLRQKRCLVLPSRQEHWGLVVHEAALCGCALILSDTIGSATDLASKDNALICAAGQTDDIYQALVTLASWNDDQWQQAEQTSRLMAKGFGPEIFQQSVQTIISKIMSQNNGRHS